MNKKEKAELKEKVKKVIENIGDFVKKGREDKGWSMSKLAEESGVSSSLISDLENKKGKMPNIFTLIVIAKTLELPDETFVNAIWDSVGKKEPTKKGNINYLKTALNNYGLPSKDMNNVLEYISYFMAMEDISSASAYLMHVHSLILDSISKCDKACGDAISDKKFFNQEGKESLDKLLNIRNQFNKK